LGWLARIYGYRPSRSRRFRPFWSRSEERPPIPNQWEAFESENVIIARYTRVRRREGQWRVQLRSAIARFRGDEFVFSSLRAALALLASPIKPAAASGAQQHDEG
jgi:hypothetical protein